MSPQSKNIFKKFSLVIILLANIGALAVAGVLFYRYLSAPAGYEVIPEYPVNAVETEKVSAPPEEKIDDPAPEKITEHNPARINLISDPAGAKIYVQGYLKGITPGEVLAVSETETGKYKITLVKEGYENWQKEIELSGGEKRELRAILKEKQ